jgi:hypothetical protein
MNVNFKNKKNLLIGGLVVLVLALSVVVIGGRSGGKKPPGVIPTETIIPTVDASVKVSLTELKKSVASLTVKNAPKGTKSIEYLISYDAEPGAAFSDEAEGLDVIPQGFQGTCRKKGSLWECGNEEPIYPGRRVIVFGSSSSGVYRFHDIVGKVKVSLKFTGSYGERIFERDYEL